jgi:hypothetical protein
VAYLQAGQKQLVPGKYHVDLVPLFGGNVSHVMLVLGGKTSNRWFDVLSIDCTLPLIPNVYDRQHIVTPHVGLIPERNHLPKPECAWAGHSFNIVFVFQVT